MIPRYGTTVHTIRPTDEPGPVPSAAVATVSWMPPELLIDTTSGGWVLRDVDPYATDPTWPHRPHDVGLALLDGPADLDREQLLTEVHQWHPGTTLGANVPGHAIGIHGPSTGRISRWYSTPLYPVLLATRRMIR